MRIISLERLSLLLIMVAAIAVPMSALAQTAKVRAVREQIFIGYISDESCGLQHMAGMDEKDCTLMCAKNGKFVLADRAHKLVYQLDKNGQEKAKEFAGQKVKIKGRVNRKTIRVIAVEAAG